MSKYSPTTAVLIVACSAFAVAAPSAGHTPSAAPYAGQQSRAVTSLSADDVADLLAGRGWGLAKPAEFNGFPGPAHVLELAEQLALTSEQRAKVEASFQAMNAKARQVGARYVAAEHAIDAAFRSGTPASTLADRLGDAERLRAELRHIHLAAHLEVTPLLTPDQRATYQRLRGYTGAADSEQRQHKH